MMRIRNLALLAALVATPAFGCAGEETGSVTDDATENRQTFEHHTLATLKVASQKELDAIYDQIDPGERIPNGESAGVAMFFSGWQVLGFNYLANGLWDGKVFHVDEDGQRGTLLNKLLFGQDAPSALRFEYENAAGDPCDAGSEGCEKSYIILDYSNSSDFRVTKIIDKLRHVHGSLYLGKAYIFGQLLCYFALDFDQTSRPTGIVQQSGSTTLAGTRFCEGCTLAEVEEEFPDVGVAINDSRFYEINDDGKNSLVMTVNPTERYLTRKERFITINDHALVERLMSREFDDQKQFQLAGKLIPYAPSGNVALNQATLSIEGAEQEK